MMAKKSAVKNVEDDPRYYANEIVDIVLGIGGTPYDWIMNSALPSLDFGSFNSVLLISSMLRIS